MSEHNVFEGKKAAYCTIGCKLNFAETASIAKTLAELGVMTAEDGECADLCVINTCTVTDMAAHKSRQAIRRMAREHPGAFIVVTGCHAQLHGDETSRIEGVDMVLGTDEKARITDYLREAWSSDTRETCHTARARDIRAFAPGCARGNRTRFFLKVQDGCDYFCTYCTIPFARGRSRNASISALVSLTEHAVREGGREIVLTGVNIGDFGKTTGETFIDLVKALDNVEGLCRLRIGSIEPDLLTDELIDYCAASRTVAPHFHIPLQSGSDNVLRLMHRHYDTRLFAHKIEKIRRLLPDAFIGVDVMAGCRGERRTDFDESAAFIRSLDISRLHVFPYSERPGTAALRIPHAVDEEEKKERCRLLIALSEEKHHIFRARYIGKDAEVLLEKAPKGKAPHGFTKNYIRVELPREDNAADYDNRLATVRINGFNSDGTAMDASLIWIEQQ